MEICRWRQLDLVEGREIHVSPKYFACRETSESGQVFGLYNYCKQQSSCLNAMFSFQQNSRQYLNDLKAPSSELVFIGYRSLYVHLHQRSSLALSSILSATQLASIDSKTIDDFEITLLDFLPYAPRLMLELWRTSGTDILLYF